MGTFTIFASNAGIGVARAQRKPAAILAADVVGYPSLIGQDESGTPETLKALRREVVDPGDRQPPPATEAALALGNQGRSCLSFEKRRVLLPRRFEARSSHSRAPFLGVRPSSGVRPQWRVGAAARGNRRSHGHTVHALHVSGISAIETDLAS
jgi:hypothetical protein